MAKWSWGDGLSLGPVDNHGARGVRLFDGSEEITDHVDFVDEEAGVYRVLVTDPAGQFKIGGDGNIAREMRHAKAGLKVFRSSEEAVQS